MFNTVAYLSRKRKPPIQIHASDEEVAGLTGGMPVDVSARRAARQSGRQRDTVQVATDVTTAPDGTPSSSRAVHNGGFRAIVGWRSSTAPTQSALRHSPRSARNVHTMPTAEPNS